MDDAHEKRKPKNDFEVDNMRELRHVKSLRNKRKYGLVVMPSPGITLYCATPNLLTRLPPERGWYQAIQKAGGAATQSNPDNLDLSLARSTQNS
jgi:hypothetical protein